MPPIALATSLILWIALSGLNLRCSEAARSSLWASSNRVAHLPPVTALGFEQAIHNLPEELQEVDRLHRQHRRILWQLKQTTRLTQHERRESIDVVVVAPSIAPWLDRRTRLREQFPKNMQLAPIGYSAVLKFAISNTGYNDTQAEAEQFSDLLFFDCIDADDALNWQQNWRLDAGPSSTTCKMLSSVQWAVKHYNFQYFFRLGDDSYFRIDKFLSLLASKQLPTGKAVIGQILKTHIIGMEQEYAQGMGYGLTPEVCDFITAAAPWLLDTAPEDGVVARWLFAVGTKFVHHPGWRSISDKDPCDESMILAHKLPIELWSNITSNGSVLC